MRITLVDGYNLIFSCDEDPCSIEEAREALIARLRPLATRRPLVLVFDGPEFTRTHRGDLEIVYAPSADQYILDELGHRNPKQISVVSSDKRLTAEARAAGAQSQSCETFLKKLSKKGRASPG